MDEGGSVILSTSFVTQFGIENFSIYSAAKSAVQSFIKTFSAECTAKKIRVNGISPGYIKTNIFNNTGRTPDQVDGAIAGITPSLPFKRFGEPLKWQIPFFFWHLKTHHTYTEQKLWLAVDCRMLNNEKILSKLLYSLTK